MKINTICTAFLAALLSILLLSGCIDLSRNQAGGYEVTDVEGTVVKIPHKPQRILTVSAGTDELMLGLVEPERLAVASSCSRARSAAVKVMPVFASMTAPAAWRSR